jgi:DNA-binding HxlR family transcriptional regulator
MGPRSNKKASKRKGEVEKEEESSIPAPPGTETTLTELGQEAMNPTAGSEEEVRL